MRIVTRFDSSANIFFNITKKILSACVDVARFASAMLWSCYILVNKAALDCADCILAAYPLVFDVLDDLRVSLNAPVE